MKKAISGYQMLMIISAADGEFQKEEEVVIREYIRNEFERPADYEVAINEFKNAPEEEWDSYFSLCRDAFYQNSTEDERHKFLQFAMDMVKADDVITEEENHYLAKLFNIWDPEEE